MKITQKGARWLSGAAVALAGAMILSSCAVNEAPGYQPGNGNATAGLSGTLNGVGASAQGSAQEAWIVGFQLENPDTNINYSPDGSGAGRDAFRGGGAVFAGTDRAFNDDEIAEDAFGTCVPGTGIIEIPAYISPIAVAFNLDGIDSLNMDAETLANVFSGEITTWNDPAIASQNEGVDLPDESIEPVFRADNSGTTENFTDYLAKVAPSAWPHDPHGDWPLTIGTAASQTSGVADALGGNVGTIGYLDASRAGDLGTVAVKVGDDYVPYSPEAAAAVVDASPFMEGRGEYDFAVDLQRDTTEGGVYPIVLISYIVACVEYQDESVVDLVKGYLSYVVSEEGQRAAADNAGSAPMSAELRGLSEDAIAAIT